MSIYKVTEIIGTSHESISDAVKVAVKRAAKTLRNVSWFEVMETRGSVKDGEVSEFQVVVKVGFRLED